MDGFVLTKSKGTTNFLERSLCLQVDRYLLAQVALVKRLDIHHRGVILEREPTAPMTEKRPLTAGRFGRYKVQENHKIL